MNDIYRVFVHEHEQSVFFLIKTDAEGGKRIFTQVFMLLCMEDSGLHGLFFVFYEIIVPEVHYFHGFSIPFQRI